MYATPDHLVHLFAETRDFAAGGGRHLRDMQAHHRFEDGDRRSVIARRPRETTQMSANHVFCHSSSLILKEQLQVLLRAACRGMVAEAGGSGTGGGGSG